MPDLGDLLSFDFGGGDIDWASALAGLGAPGDLGDFDLFDTETGMIVDPSTVDPAAIVNMDFGGLPVANSPVSTSTSDQLRSREVDPATAGSERFDWNAMADPSASIASAGDGWMKALTQGLGSALGGLGGGLSGLARGAGDGGGVPGASPMMGASMPGGGPMTDGGGGGGLSGLIRPGLQDPIGAAYASLTPAQRAQLGMTPPIDPGREPVKFTPLQLPTAGGAVPMAGVAPAQRMGGLQRLLSERLG